MQSQQLRDGWRWVPIVREQELPSDAVQAGEDYVGRIGSEIGRISTYANALKMLYFDSVSHQQSLSAEILCCQMPMSWCPLVRGENIPDGAVMAGTTRADGLTYVGRLKGSTGKINVSDGKMYNFWGRRPFDQSPVSSSGFRMGISRAIARAGYNLDVSSDGLKICRSNEMDSQSCEILVVKCNVPPPSRTLRVMQFNIWQEGASVADGLPKVADAIIASDVEVVALSEIRNYQRVDFHERLKAALAERGQYWYGSFLKEGWNDVGLISRYPIKKVAAVCKMPSDLSSKMVAYHLAVPRHVCVVTGHLGWREYCVNLPRGYGCGSKYSGFRMGKLLSGPVTDLEVLRNIDNTSNRGPALECFMRYARQLGADVPVVIAGDFNECSHLDWTVETKDMYGHNGVVMPWKNSQMLLKNGFIDSWRELYPSPVTHPGVTWPSEAFGKKTS
jgi:exonuclease III